MGTLLHTHGVKVAAIVVLGIVSIGLAACEDSPPATSTPVRPQSISVVNTPIPVQPSETPVATPMPNPQEIAAATQTVGVASTGGPPGSNGFSYYYADATSHSVSEFAEAYEQFGGVAGLGYPLAEAFIEQSSADGKWYWVQYFEKAVIEYHRVASQVDRFQLTPLGVWRFTQRYVGGTPPVKQVLGKGSYKFPETNHTVSGAFLIYWHKNGEVRRFGYPISEAFEEKSDTDGKTYTMQYFERAVMEYHPELKAANNVQLTALGSLKLGQVYPSGAPAGASNPIPSPTPNAAATAQAVANMTATIVAGKRSAEATATVRTLESYKSKAPSGDYSQNGSVAIWCGYIEYRHSVGYSTANRNSRFIVMSVSVTNNTEDTLYVNPNDFTLISTDGNSVPHDSSTYSFDTPFPGVTLQPEAYADGALSFLVSGDFIPSRLVWKDFYRTVTVTIVDEP